MNWEQHNKRVQRVRADAASANAMFGRCRAWECKNPARAATGKGLDRRWCRVHADHLSRHGDVYKKSLPAAATDPWRRKALAWLRAGNDDLFVRCTIGAVERLYRAAGPHVEAFRLAGLTPAERAKAQWARLRKAEVDPRRIIASYLAVVATIEHDPQKCWKSEYRRVQAAKVVHRLASGSHRVWERPRVDLATGRETVYRDEMHKYPHSRGRVLRHVGFALEKASELLTDRWMAHIAPALALPGGGR